MVEPVINLSRSVQDALTTMPAKERVPAWTLVKALFHLHPDYAGGHGRELQNEAGPSQGDWLPVDDWLQNVQRLYDPTKTTHLDTRLMIWGLAALDSALRDYLTSSGVLDALTSEIEKEHKGVPPDQLLQRPDDATAGSPDQEQRRVDGAQTEVSQAQTETWQHAVLLAETMANTAPTPRPADSVLLLAALFSLASRREDLMPNAFPGATDLLQTMVRARGADAASHLEQPIVSLLDLEKRYGIVEIPHTPHLGSQLNAAHSAELDQVLRAAHTLAQRTTSDGLVGERHVLGTLLAPRLVYPRPLVQEYLQQLGHDIISLRRALLEGIRTRDPSDRLDDWEQVLLAPPAPGYISDYVDPEVDATDHLTIDGEVAALAHVLISKRVTPPLALGLFGDWGSGKSFFMTKLRRYIETSAEYYRTEEKHSGDPSPWCSRVIQFDFNAWHFSDTNLWASLVTRIYEGIDQALSDQRSTDKQLQENLGKQIQQAQGMVSEAQAELGKARSRVEVAEIALVKAQEDCRQEQAKLSGLIGDVQVLLQNNDGVRSKLDKASAALGYPEAARTYDALVELNSRLKSFSGRLAALTVNLLQAPWTLLMLALLIIGLPLGVGVLLRHFGDQVGLVGQRMGEVSAFLFGIIAWLKTQMGRGLTLVGEVDTALDEARRTRQDRLASSAEVRQVQQALTLAQAAEDGARTNLQTAQAELQRLQSELEDLRPERKLYRLIEERARTAAYSQYLGIISLIRTDFEQMSRLLVEMIAERRDLKTQDPPIQRIILYIDDLDRCQPERVVQVLEAMHLLLAFPLFIVVVGVDPRWLRHSLASHHPQTLGENGPRLVLDSNTSPAYYSTPQDYLEKIFQIPFALRPVEEDGYKRLVTDLLQPLPDPVQREPQSSATAIITSESSPAAQSGRSSAESRTDNPVAPPSSARELQHIPVEDGGAAAGDEGGLGHPRPAEPQHEAAPFTPLNPEQLDFKAWEEQDIHRLWPLFRTPRSIKRFVNIYRLLRASLATDLEVTRFEGTQEQPGEYQQVLLLLAVVTAFPNEATRFLYWLKDWLEAGSDQSADNNIWHWQDGLMDMRGKLDRRPGDRAAVTRNHGGSGQRRASVETTSAPMQHNRTATGANGRQPDDGEAVDADVAWEMLIDRLGAVTSTGFTHPFSKRTAQQWAARVARYSFSIQSVDRV